MLKVCIILKTKKNWGVKPLCSVDLITGIVLCLSPKEQREKRLYKSLCESKGKCFGTKMKKKWEGQFIDPSVCYKCNVMPT